MPHVRAFDGIRKPQRDTAKILMVHRSFNVAV